MNKIMNVHCRSILVNPLTQEHKGPGFILDTDSYTLAWITTLNGIPVALGTLPVAR